MGLRSGHPEKLRLPGSGKKFSAVYAYSLRGRDGAKHQYSNTHNESSNEVRSFNDPHCIRSASRNSL